MKPLTYLRAWLVLTVLWFTAFSAVAYAADTLPVNPTDTLASVRLSAITMTFVVGSIVPLIVGFVTNIRDHAFLKGVLMLLLNAVNAVIAQATLADGSAVFSKSLLVPFIVGAAASVIAYYNAWKPLHATSSAVPVRQSDGTVVAVPGNLSTAGLRKAA